MRQQLIELLLEKLLLSDSDDSNEYKKEDEFLGKYVIVRGYYAGVWAGVLVDDTKGAIILKDARMLWRWWAKEGIGLSGVAKYGLAGREEVKVLVNQDLIKITDDNVSTFFICSKEAEQQIRNIETAKQF